MSRLRPIQPSSSLQILWWSLFFQEYSLLKKEKTLGPRLYTVKNFWTETLQSIHSRQGAALSKNCYPSGAQFQRQNKQLRCSSRNFFTIFLSRVPDFPDLEKDNYTTVGEEVVVRFGTMELPDFHQTAQPGSGSEIVR